VLWLVRVDQVVDHDETGLDERDPPLEARKPAVVDLRVRGVPDGIAVAR
jgi:hypothetical protein